MSLAARLAARRFAAERCAFTLLEHERWQAGVGPYDKLFSPLTKKAAARLATLATATSGRGLDCATGPGYVVEEALARGAKGEDLVGLDFSSAMLSKAQERIREPGVTWKEADMQEALGPELGSFAWCTCNFGVLHLARPQQFFKVAREALLPGGFFAFTVWAELAKSPLFQIVLRAVEAHGTSDVGLPPGPPFFKYSDASVSKEALVEAGFDASSITAEELELELRVEDPDELWHGFYDGTARTGAMLARQSPEAQERIRKAMREAVLASGTAAPYTLRQPCLLVTAAVPASV